MACSIEGCDRKVFAKGLCQTHYKWQRSGKDLTQPVQQQYHGLSEGDRFMRRVREAESGCWLWEGGKDVNGYGQIRLSDGKRALSHRVSWALSRGEIPAGKVVCHRCDTPACVNPDHLFLGTQADNVADMHAKGRARKRALQGVDHAKAKLTQEAVRFIRSSALTDAELAQRFSVSRASVHAVRTRKTWKHIP